MVVVRGAVRAVLAVLYSYCAAAGWQRTDLLG